LRSISGIIHHSHTKLGQTNLSAAYSLHFFLLGRAGVLDIRDIRDMSFLE
jgi:hypothetical protein